MFPQLGPDHYLGFVWMYILEALELNWAQYQISPCIEIGSNVNSCVWLQMNLLFGITELNKFQFLFGCLFAELAHLLFLSPRLLLNLLPSGRPSARTADLYHSLT